MNEEKMMILKMLQKGKISADEAAKLLDSLDSGGKNKEYKKQTDEPRKNESKFFRVSITDTTTGKSRANIRMPLSVMGIGMQFGAHFTPQIDGVESDQLMDAIRIGQVGKIIDVYDDKDGEHVEIYIE